MFFLIPLGISAVSAITTSTMVGSAVATGLAIGLKKAADKVEEDNICAVNRAHKESSAMLHSYSSKVNSDKSSYKTRKADELRKQISLSEMNKADKETCLAHLNKMPVVQ